MGQIKIETIIGLDFVDSIKVLFGKRIKVNIIADTLEEVTRINAHSTIEIIGTSEFKLIVDRPGFGYSAPMELTPQPPKEKEELTTK